MPRSMQTRDEMSILQNANFPLYGRIAACKHLFMNIAHSFPRPWLTRKAGECAFPVLGEGEDVLSCCRPATDGPYCAAHRAKMKGPPAPGFDDMLRDLIRFIG